MRVKKKNNPRAKLKAASQEERLKIWKEHFRNLLENYPKVIAKIIKTSS